MTLTADQLRWLESSAPNGRCCLVRLTFLGNNSGSPVEMHAYISNMPYISHATDIPPHQIFDECIVEPPTFTMRMAEQMQGRSQLSYGDLIVINPIDWPLTTTSNLQVLPAGERDDWLSMNWDGRRMDAWIGDPSWAFADFIPYIGDGRTMDVYDVGGGKIGFKISDKGGMLDQQIMLDVLATGPNAGSPMPLLYGVSVSHFEPKLEDAATHRYRVTKTTPFGIGEWLGDDPIGVFENGYGLDSGLQAVVSVDDATDLLTVTGHGGVVGSRVRLFNFGGGTAPGGLAFNTDYWMPARTTDTFSLSATQGGTPIDITDVGSGTFYVQIFSYTADPANGTFTLVASPAGRITASSNGLRVFSATTQVRTAGGIAEQVLTSYMTNTPLTSADIDTTSLDNFKALCDSPVGIYIDKRMTFAELLDKLVLSVGGWWAFSRAGKLVFGRLDLPTGLSPLYTFIADDIAQRSFKRQRRILPKLRVTLRTDINYAPLSEVAAAVDEVQRVGFTRQYLEFAGSASTITSWQDNPAYHLRATTPEPIETLLRVEGQQAEANRQASLWQTPTAVSSFDTHQAAFALEIGDEIYADLPRYSGPAIVVGVTCRVLGKSTVEIFHQTPEVNPGANIPPPPDLTGTYPETARWTEDASGNPLDVRVTEDGDTRITE